MTTWGIVSTIKAPLRAVLDFAAWHLELGAHRLYLHLDEPDDATFAVLKSHPRIRPVVTDDAYWIKSGRPRPRKHQPRQTYNASLTYAKRADVDWLGHLDADEFLVLSGRLSDHLAVLPSGCHVARIRPMEALADAKGPLLPFKTLVLNRAERRRLAQEVWPTYGPYLNGGFLSHVAGKIFVRTGLRDADFRIHNFYTGGVENPGAEELDTVNLAHLHAKSWEQWLASYRYRHENGSYRAELKPERPRDKGGLTLNELFATIEAEGGETALMTFFDEVCAATPDHLSRLSRAELLREVSLPLDAVREKHFPGFV
ncbi:hypothetical protein GCM10011360_18960 [Primorskyibacter flagellatus]|uniref:Glycosyl transferase family 2 n=1 Tax=Primorskyibacter flagellatus TaxID=1387277 RepID=A0A917A7U4_9RHOB|nr:glycosyltransferase family 2 protein [Primorskyibacter flagellatus]GGE31226.1 hypothetical protein GCM10011360_18960 [Primorskyibacter flagellatus]